jgi:protein-L-isoaspartate O-methyltransferase
MLQQEVETDRFLSELQSIRSSFAEDVRVLTEAVAKRSNLDVAKIDTTCHRIAQKCRDYPLFMNRVNAARVHREQEAETREDLLNARREWGQLTARSGLFWREIGQWNAVHRLVRRQVDTRRKRLPLYDKKPTETSITQLDLSDAALGILHAIFNPTEQSEEAQKHGCFADIALPNSEFHKHMHAAYRVALAKTADTPARFLDVGCGCGLKVLSASQYVREAHGLDYQQSYVDIAQRLTWKLRPDETEVFQADALTFDSYHEYDLIYFYRPMSDDAKLMEMERRIVDTARPGTVLVAPYLGFSARHTELGCGCVSGQVFVTQTSQRAADRLRREAEKTGPDVAVPTESKASTIWTPLLEASRKRGFDLPQGKTPV